MPSDADTCALCNDGGAVELRTIADWTGDIVEFEDVYIPCPRCSGDETAISEEEENDDAG